VTSSHIFFIPGMIMIGLFLGFILGLRAAKNQADIAERREVEREAARAARAARRNETPKAEEPPADEAKAKDETVTAPGKPKSKSPQSKQPSD
jgi:hypothetical protein